jgi:hypothetical protein
MITRPTSLHLFNNAFKSCHSNIQRKTKENRAYQQLLHHSVTLQTRSEHMNRSRREAKLGGPMPWCLLLQQFLYNVCFTATTQLLHPVLTPQLHASSVKCLALVATSPCTPLLHLQLPNQLQLHGHLLCNPTSKLFFTPSSSSYRLSHHVKLCEYSFLPSV